MKLTNKEEQLLKLKMLLDESLKEDVKMSAYEDLIEDSDEIVDEIIKAESECQNDAMNKILMDILSYHPGHEEIYLRLISHLYQADDVGLYAKLIGRYGDERAVEVLKGFLVEYEPNYYEFLELRAAIEWLGGEIDDMQDEDFEDDPLYQMTYGELEKPSYEDDDDDED